MIRVLVVEDSLTVRKWIVEILEDAPQFEVVAEAQDGLEAVECVEQVRPDVITMDLMMPRMTGDSATEYIMAQFPTPILILSASTNRGELLKTYDALAAGAVSVFEKPQKTGFELWKKKFLRELEIVSRVPVLSHIRGASAIGRAIPRCSRSSSNGKRTQVIALGASTGGPQVLLKIFQSLPVDFPIPLVCVLHLNAFSGMLAEWFDMNCDLKVCFAEHLMPFSQQKGCVFLAPPDHHLSIQGELLHLSQGELRNYCRPSIDTLFESVALNNGKHALSVLLTGIGRDGAMGSKRVKEAGGHTIAQDEDSSTVYGMPKHAVELGGIQQVSTPEEIISTLLEIANEHE